VGNKSDMDESKRAVPFSRGQALADEYNMQFFETSAKNNTNVDEVFQVGGMVVDSRWVGFESEERRQHARSMAPSRKATTGCHDWVPQEQRGW